MTYHQARRITLVAGVLVLGLIALVMALRHVEAAEVGAVLLFAPVFVAFMVWNEVGGVVVALAAAGGYIALRASAIHAVGASHFTGLVGSRSVGYVVFGLVGGWANRQLRESLVKLDLYDQIDDATRLFNARFLLQETDLEMARARRYQTFFGVALVDVPVSRFEKVSRRARARILRDVGRMLSESVRHVDRAVHGLDGSRHRFAVILPETGPEGSRIFSDRLRTWIDEFLAGRGVTGPGATTNFAFTYPEDEAGMDRLRSEFATIDATEHEQALAVDDHEASPA